MITSPKALFCCMFLLFSLPGFSQEKPGDYYDINKVLYKRITSIKEGLQTTWYDTKGSPLPDMCKSNDPEYVRFADIQIGIFRLLSERLKDDSSRKKKSVEFCFAVSDKGVSNIRLISYELSYTKEEVQQLLETLLNDIDLRASTSCTLVVEIPYWDYMIDPVSNSKE